MRLIDADALDVELNKAYEDIIMDEQREGFNIACSVIDKMPTVEPKQGECTTCIFYGDMEMCCSCNRYYGDMYAPKGGDEK